MLAQVPPERNATGTVTSTATGTGIPGPEDVAGILSGTPVSTDLQWEYQEPYRLLRRAARLLDDADLKGASETLKEAARVMALQSANTADPDLPGKTEQTNNRNRGSQA